MTASKLLTELRARGITVRIAGPDTLGLSPATAVDDALKAKVRRFKPQLLALLADRTVIAPATCAWCGGTLAPILIVRPGALPTLHCPSCHRWTTTGRPA